MTEAQADVLYVGCMTRVDVSGMDRVTELEKLALLVRRDQVRLTCHLPLSHCMRCAVIARRPA